MARLIPYGPVAPTGSASLGQALADLLDEPVVVYDRPDWLPAADEVTYRTGRPAGVQVQPTPEPAQSAVPPPWGIDEERAWLRRTHGREFDARASSVARILSQSPGMRGDPATQSEVITDLVAVEIFLSTDTRLDDVVRAGAPGPHLPLARCVASGLQRLPTYRGVVALRSTLTDDEWAWFGQARDLTDWGFLTAHTGERRGVAGNVDFLIWSQTARRTASLRPADPGRVVFPPGSQFTVLGTRTSDNARVVLLRERSAADAVALAGLEQAVSRWLDANPVPRSPAPPGERTVGVPAPGQAPGLILGMP
jgi:hypothetical protein